MISHAARCIFVHQRKSAGTSVKALFPDAVGADRGLFNDGLLDPAWTERPDLVAAYFKFTVVRNPWDRFVSAWRYCDSTKGRDIKDVLRHPPPRRLVDGILADGASLRSRAAYAAELTRRRSAVARHLFRTRVLGRSRRPPHDQGHDYRHVTRLQTAAVVHPDGRLAVDRVVFFEDLTAGLAEVFATLGLPAPSLPEMKVRRRGDDYRRHFDDEARALFEADFGADLAYWGYDFDSGLPKALRAG